MSGLRAAVAVVVLAWLVVGPVGCGGRTREQDGATPNPAIGTPAAQQPGSTRAAPAATPAGQEAPPTETALVSTPAGVGPPEAQRLVLLATQDLSRREGIPESDISVAAVAAETWRDSSLGCPEPGRVYAQVLTPGYRIVLEARGRRHEYHTDASRVAFCRQP